MIEYKAIQQNISLDYESGKKLITFMVEDASDQGIEWSRGKDLRITVKEWKNKRSLDANAYYHALLGKLASKLRMSTTELHNRMLMQHGQLDMIGDNLITVELPDTLEAERKAYTADTYHLKPTSEVKVYHTDGREMRIWLMLRGSHTYNTAEFSMLLNGLIEECKWQGIPTDTPEQIAQMMALYGEKYEKKTS